MDHYKTIIQTKMSKVESSLTDVNNEVSAVIQHLSELKESCDTVVKNLKMITEPANYLQEFVNVNSFLLKSLSFLTEINCKFEMLDISQSWVTNSISNSELHSSALNLALGNKGEKHSDTPILNSNITKTKPEDVTPQTVNQVTESKKKKKNKKSQQCLPNTHNDKSAKTTVIENDCKKSPEVLKNSDSLGKPDTKTSKKIIEETDTPNKNISSTPLSNSPVNNTSESLPSESVSAIGSSASQAIDWWDCANGTQTPKTPSTTESVKNPQEEVRENKIESELDIEPPVSVRNVGEEYDIIIENIKSPSEFYISIKSHSKLLIEMEEHLKLIPAVDRNNFRKAVNKKDLLTKEIGNYALFYSRCDEIWCRVKIINWNLNFNDDFVSVFLLDYGEFKCVSIHDIQPLPKYLKKYSAFTMRCHLSGVFPIDLDENTETLSWGKDSTEAMRFITETSENIRMKIAPNDDLHTSSSLPVKLFLVDQEKWVHDLLVGKKLATLDPNTSPKNITSQVDTDKNENLDNWNPMKEDFESYQNSYGVDINDPGNVIYGYVGKDYERICKHFAETGYCFKGKSCRKEHSKFDPLGYTTDEEEIYKNAFNSLPVPQPNSVVNVQVTCVLSFNQFFCFLEKVDMSFKEETLQSLLVFMNLRENVKEMKKLLNPPSVGQIVIARYSGDNAWYRARILESEPEADCYKVMFVDYGNKEIRSLADIRAMEARYLHLPFQAVECFLFGIERNQKKKTDEALEFVKKRMGDGQLRIEVVERLPGEQVHLLVNAFDQKGRNLADILIVSEYATLKKEEMIIDSACQTVPG